MTEGAHRNTLQTQTWHAAPSGGWWPHVLKWGCWPRLRLPGLQKAVWPLQWGGAPRAGLMARFSELEKQMKNNNNPQIKARGSAARRNVIECVSTSHCFVGQEHALVQPLPSILPRDSCAASLLFFLPLTPAPRKAFMGVIPAFFRLELVSVHRRDLKCLHPSLIKNKHVWGGLLFGQSNQQLKPIS